MSSYFSFNALNSQRSSGYRNTTYALAELIDNAFDAGAKLCRIIFIEKRDSSGRKYIDEIIICDDGEGMNDSILHSCLQFGGTTNEDLETITSTKKIGKFGYGLPNASLSQCPNITVYSWVSSDSIRMTKLVLEELKESESIDIPELETTEIPSYYEGLDAVIKKSSGTIISWKDCDRLSNTKAETIIRKSEELAGKLFRYLINKNRKIEFVNYELSKSSNTYNQQDNMVVRPNDPLFLMSNTVISTALYNEANKQNGLPKERDPATYYKKFSISKNKCKPTNNKVEDYSYKFSFEWKGKEYPFEITTSVADIDIQKPGIREGGDPEVGKFYKKKERDCISFVRSDREISSGNYDFYNQADPRHRWWSIEIKFLPDSDDLLGVHNNKQGIEFVYTDDMDPTENFEAYTASLQQAREQLWMELTKRIVKAQKGAWKIVLDNHKKWGLKNNPEDKDDTGKPVLPGGTTTTTTIQLDTDGKRKGQFSEEEIKALFDRLSEKYSDIPSDDIMRSIEMYDAAEMRGCILYSHSESEKLWSLTSVWDFLIVMINTNHMFYQNMIAPLKETGKESALSAIELFISSLAWEEHNHFGSGKSKDIIEQFRSYVGLHLNSYLKEFNYLDETND